MSDDIDQETARLEKMISHLGFMDKRDNRIEVSIPFAEPIARHLTERGVRVCEDLAVIKPVRGEGGVQVWVGVDEPDPEPVFDEHSPEDLAEMRDAFAAMQVKLDAAYEAAKGRES